MYFTSYFHQKTLLAAASLEEQHKQASEQTILKQGTQSLERTRRNFLFRLVQATFRLDSLFRLLSHQSQRTVSCWATRSIPCRPDTCQVHTACLLFANPFPRWNTNVVLTTGNTNSALHTHLLHSEILKSSFMYQNMTGPVAHPALSLSRG